MTKSAESAEPEKRQAHARLVGEVELVNRLQERELRPMREATEAGMAALGDLPDQGREEVVEGPLLFLGACNEVAPDAPRVGEVQALEQPIEIDVSGLHSASSWRRRPAAGGSDESPYAMYSAPNKRSVRPRSKAARKVSAPWPCSSSCN